MDATVVRTAMSTASGAHDPTMPSTLARTQCAHRIGARTGTPLSRCGRVCA